MPVDPLPASASTSPATRRVSASRHTAEIEPSEGIVGQDRAVEAVEFAIGMRREGYNLFVQGPEGIGRFTLLRQALGAAAVRRPVARRLVLRPRLRRPPAPAGDPPAGRSRSPAPRRDGALHRRAPDRPAGGLRGRGLPGASRGARGGGARARARTRWRLRGARSRGRRRAAAHAGRHRAGDDPWRRGAATRPVQDAPARRSRSVGVARWAAWRPTSRSSSATSRPGRRKVASSWPRSTARSSGPPSCHSPRRCARRSPTCPEVVAHLARSRPTWSPTPRSSCPSRERPRRPRRRPRPAGARRRRGRHPPALRRQPARRSRRARPARRSSTSPTRPTAT